jgi:hypothetical protein
MKFLLIGSELTTRAYAFEFEGEDVKAALKVASDMSEDLQRSSYYPLFLINQDTNECLRVVRALGSDVRGYEGPEYAVSPSAFVVAGMETPDEYYSKPQTAEMSE